VKRAALFLLKRIVHAYIALYGLSGLRRGAASCHLPVSPSYLCAIVNDSLDVSRAPAQEKTGAAHSLPQVVPFISSTVVSRWINSSRASSKQFNLHKLTATCLCSRRRWGDSSYSVERIGCKTAASPSVTLVYSQARSAFVLSRVTWAGKSGRREQRRWNERGGKGARRRWRRMKVVIRWGVRKEERTVGRRLQESTVPQIRDKAGLAPRIYDLASVSPVPREWGIRDVDPLAGESTIDWIIVPDRFRI